MPRPKPYKDPTSTAHHCARCDTSFDTRPELSHHIAGHADSLPEALTCPACGWPFPDSLALEQHFLQAGHGSAQFACDTCGRTFTSQQGLDRHLQPPSSCLKAVASTSAAQGSDEQPAQTSQGRIIMGITCDRCPKTFSTQRQYNAHRSFPDGECADHKKSSPPKESKRPTQPSYVDLDRPQKVASGALGYHDRPDSPDNMSSDDDWCPDCETIFKSKAKFNAHALRCSSQAKPNGQLASTSKAAIVRPESSEARQATLSSVRPARLPASSSPSISETQSNGPSPFLCNLQGCGKACRSEAGLKVHQADIHGIGGTALDLHGNQSFMLNQRIREQLRSEGLLRPPSGSPRGRGRGRGRGGAAPMPTRPPAPPPPTVTRLPQASVVGSNPGSAGDMEQAKYIQGKVLRLLIQSDILIHHGGKITVCGIDWTRIGVSRQREVVELFEAMCHLPKMLQGEYLPPPTTFKDEYTAQYPVIEFQSSPHRDLVKPGCGIVALSCSKVLLADGCQGIVKIAAVDLVTGRILMNHLVCDDPHAKVAHWRSSVTGISRWHDFEGARQAGYKIFKGWPAARSALWKFIDKETIVVGHNLRSDLDALRMIHGRAVDVAKVVEKAAKGPLSKAQLSLDSLCRDYPREHLKTDPKYGRDCLMDAFAARELGLWIIKYKDLFEKNAKQKSLDYQRLMPKATTPA